MSIVLFCQMKGVVYFLFERWYKQYRNIEFISVEIMYGGESVQNISKDDVQSIEIGIKNLVLVFSNGLTAVSYTHLRAHETGRNLVCRLLLEKIFF